MSSRFTGAFSMSSGAIAIVSMGAVLAVSVLRNIIALYRLERLACTG